MALILLIETSTANCSAALARDGEVIIEKSSDAGYVHAEKLAVQTPSRRNAGMSAEAQT